MKKLLRLVVCASALAALAFAQDKVDLDTIYKIKQEAFQNSKVMDHLWYLTEVHGPRLAGSPHYKAAADWAVKTLKDWGLDNARLEEWGKFGRGWENKKFTAAMTEPSYMPLIGAPQAWTASTEGVISGEPIIALLRTDEDLAKWKGKLTGKIVLTESPREIALHDKADDSRYTDAELAELATGQISSGMLRRPPAGGPPQNFMQMMAFRRKMNDFLRDEKVGVVLSGTRGDFGTYFTSNGGSRDPKDPQAPPMVVLTPEHYNRIYRLAEKSIATKLEIEVQNQWYEPDQNNFNVIAELPGTGKHKDEIVMIGGHLDSWHSATGATDNGTGSAVMLEVMRILKKLDLKLDRTVRIGLWDAEEEGLLGSRGYVTKTFADRSNMKTLPAWDKLSAYYNVDNGAGKIRGVYLQGNEAARPVLEAFLAPFKDLGVTTVTSRNTGGTDHQSFDAVGLPGFQFIQDPLEYSTRTHHSNMDSYDRVPREDMMQMAAIVASLVVDTANRDHMMPRKPKPEPRAEGRGPMGF
ncbi:M20/M25/M40 family metallo-hydrolase [Paludibaculum fermentans]|uniref:Carboxypeptidase Q n=1 Tax=Paludibaculum fermentans TaxID=1473598 RepID=A0A7S7NJX5_PALFE|nr:M20/M25/M40 family metallo-hydrolase [Paludibaculum fermentans]QOY84934.1 M20/M25/M40 family metallo-hydrolase [Paludibaculum fermentans]